MNARVVAPARGPLDAVVSVPGSKSLANRALVCAALADGATRLEHVPDGDDTAAMIDCLRRLSMSVEQDSDSVTLEGFGGALPTGPVVLPTRLAGTTSRFLTALCSLGPGPYIIDGEAALRSRPMGPLHDALSALGAVVDPLDRPGHLPVRVSAGRRGAETPVVRIRGDISSQYVSALMMIAPYLAGGLRLELTTSLISRPYVDMTAEVMARFGHDAVRFASDGDHGVIEIAPGRYRGCRYTVESDASTASYPLAAAAAVGGRVRVEGLRLDSTQSDIRFVEVLRSMGCAVAESRGGVTVERRGALRGVTVDMADYSDTAPTLAAIAPLAATPTRITGIGFIRRKESDRIGDVATELRKCGVRCTEEPDGLLIEPAVPTGAIIATHHDHRIAMSFAILGLAVRGVSIADPDVVSKSFPAFWNLLERLTDGKS